MSWREAIILQAKSENRIRLRLNHPDPSDDEPPATTHHAFVRLLQVLKHRPEIRHQLGYRDAVVFQSFINSLLDVAGEVERLAPSAAGIGQPNPEYPWRDPTTGGIEFPAGYEFPQFSPGDPRMIKLEKLIDSLLRIAA